MKRIKWILPLLITFLVCGCNYHELNDIYLVSALSVDFDQEYHISLLIASDDEENSTRTIEGHGKTLEEALKLKNTDVVNSLGGLPPVKLHCSVLAEEAIHEAIANYYRKEEKLTEEEIKSKCNLKEHHCESCGI